MSPVRTAIEQPITVAVGVLLSLLAGLVAFDRVPIQMTPEVQDTVIAVTTNWENASPQEVESEIVDRQEEKLQAVTNLRSLTSTSSRGQAVVRLEFRTGTDKDAALREVSDKLREVPDYPANVDEPIVENTDPETRDYIAWFVVTCSDPKVDVRTLEDWVEKRIKPRLERLPGMSEVNILGGRERETQIRFDATKLASRGITVAQFVEAIRSANANFSAGALEQGKNDIRVRTVGRFSDPEQVGEVVVRQDDSGIVFLRDVAEVVETFKEQAGFVRSTGQVALALNFQRETGSNLLEVMSGLQAEVAVLNRDGGAFDAYARAHGIDGSLQMQQVYDQTEYVYQALDLVQSNIVIGGALATIILLLFLRSVRSVGIIALAIPISVVGAVVMMVVLGRTINVISLAGMAFAVGMVVDNAIVVIENIFRHLEMGKGPRRAALDGTTEVAGAVLASTLTTVVVFIPVLLIEEVAGQLFRDIALAICSAVGLSYLVSVLVIPCGAALLLKQRAPKTAAAPRPAAGPGWFGRYVGAIGRSLDLRHVMDALIYRINGRWTSRIAVVLVMAVVSVGGSVVLLPPVDYLPKGNRNIVFGLMIPPPGYSVDQLHEIGERVEAKIADFWAVNDVPVEELRTVVDFMAPTAEKPVVRPPKIEDYFFVATGGQVFHGGIAAEDRKVIDMVPLFNDATGGDTAPGTLAFAFQLPLFQLGGATGSAVKIDISGPNLESVSASAGALFGTLFGAYPDAQIQPVPSNFNLQAPELRVVPDFVRMSDLGLTVADIGLMVQAAGDGALVGEYEMPDELVDLRVIERGAAAAPIGSASAADALATVQLATASGQTIGLQDVTEFQYVTAPEQIRRVGRQRAVTLEFTPPPGAPLQQAQADLTAAIDGLRQAGAISNDVQVELAGTSSKLDEILAALLGDGSWSSFVTSSLFLALLVVYLLMCVLFQSWLFPFVIMFTVPLATFGGFLGLATVYWASVVDRYAPVQNLDVLTILGFVILAGVVVNNAILLVTQTQNFLSGDGSGDDMLDTGEEMTPRRAVSLAVRTRVRPIFMSMLTSVGGMVPLVVTPGSGSELYRGLGAVVVGGLLMSTVFTLLLVPTLLSMLYDFGLGASRPAHIDDEVAVEVGESEPAYS